MAEYLLQDKDKAAFINRMNKVLSQIGSGFGLDQSSFVDVPETEDDDKCIYIASTDVEEKVLDSLIDKNAFTYKIKKINVNEILREIEEEFDYITNWDNVELVRTEEGSEGTWCLFLGPEGPFSDDEDWNFAVLKSEIQDVANGEQDYVLDGDNESTNMSRYQAQRILKKLNNNGRF